MSHVVRLEGVTFPLWCIEEAVRVCDFALDSTPLSKS